MDHAELKNSSLGAGTKQHHFSYLGDAEVGEEVNIGAGAITANFDGEAKHRTVIGDGAFIGVDTLLRAPVTIGPGARTGAGRGGDARRAGRQDGGRHAGARDRAPAQPDTAGGRTEPARGRRGKPHRCLTAAVPAPAGLKGAPIRR